MCIRDRFNTSSLIIRTTTQKGSLRFLKIKRLFNDNPNFVAVRRDYIDHFADLTVFHQFHDQVKIHALQIHVHSTELHLLGEIQTRADQRHWYIDAHPVVIGRLLSLIHICPRVRRINFVTNSFGTLNGSIHSFLIA